MISKPPGIEDIFPDRGVLWDNILGRFRLVLNGANYREIIVPVMEFTEVFSRGIGDDTDIVSKEMFTFEDRGGRSLTLRPEGTAGVVRAFVENGDYNRLALSKFFYSGAMFRAEKPQKGRLRQFNQFGAEVFGSSNPFHDFELIWIINEVSRGLGIPRYEILLNSIGCRKCRPDYTGKLKEYYSQHIDSLCKDCSRRLETNPLRLLDCKEKGCRELRSNAPEITTHLCGECEEHFKEVRGYLDGAGIDYVLDPFLVRGLDYYTKTTFEFSSDLLGSQSAFAGGGRYDHLVEKFGGKPTPAVGFAAGIERIMLLLENEEIPKPGLDAFVVYSGEEARALAVKMVNELRAKGFSIDFEPDPKGFKAQMKKANRDGAEVALIMGEDELAQGTVTVKNLKTGEQGMVSLDKGIYESLWSHIGPLKNE